MTLTQFQNILHAREISATTFRELLTQFQSLPAASQVEVLNPGQNPPQASPDPVPPPAITQTEEWKGYVSMRKKIKCPLTDRAAAMALRNLEKLAPGNIDMQKQILDQSTLYCWKGLFKISDQPPAKTGNTGQAGPAPASYDITELEEMIDSPLEQQGKEFSPCPHR